MMELVTNLTFNDKYKGSTGICSYNQSQRDALFLNFVLVKNSTCFGQTYCPSSGVLILYSQQEVFVILGIALLVQLTDLYDSKVEMKCSMAN